MTVLSQFMFSFATSLVQKNTACVLQNGSYLRLGCTFAVQIELLSPVPKLALHEEANGSR
jgi:hypothetical protein